MDLFLGKVPLVLTFFTLCSFAACKAERASEFSKDESATPPPSHTEASGETRLRSVYVPAYSHVSLSEDGKRRSFLRILLSVRNVDPSTAVTLTHVEYFDTSGHRVRSFVRGPRELKPLETAEFHVDTLDDEGGSGANFLVYWQGPSDAHALLTEAVMVAPGYVVFTSRGVELPSRPELPKLDLSPNRNTSDASGQRDTSTESH